MEFGSMECGEQLAKAQGKGGYIDLVEFFISKGSEAQEANDWNYGMRGAVKGGHKILIDFFISKGANNWNDGMAGAFWALASSRRT